MNSQSMENSNFHERTVVYAENQTDILMYEYMHIRLKKQSTKYIKASPTGNSIPHYVTIALHSNNLLKVYANLKRVLPIGQNSDQLMSINLTAEGVCQDASEVVMIESAKSPFGSYKKDNGDLKPEDRPWISILTKSGKYFHF